MMSPDAQHRSKGLVVEALSNAVCMGLVRRGDRAVICMRGGGRFAGPTVHLVVVGDDDDQTDLLGVLE
jgi:hypothetical protein